MAGNSNSGRKAQRRPRSKIPALVELPDPPDDMGEAGLKHWRRVGPLLVHARVLTLLNLPSLEMLCEVYDRWSSNRATVKLEGSTMPGGKKHALLGVIQRDEVELMRLNAEFGMSAATASSRMTAPSDPTPESDADTDDEAEGEGADELLFGALRVVS